MPTSPGSGASGGAATGAPFAASTRAASSSVYQAGRAAFRGMACPPLYETAPSTVRQSGDEPTAGVPADAPLAVTRINSAAKMAARTGKRIPTPPCQGSYGLLKAYRMPPHVKHTNGPGETEAAGAALASRLTPGDVVLVTGELGSGKTTFVRGACRALGVEGPVTSPT